MEEAVQPAEPSQPWTVEPGETTEPIDLQAAPEAAASVTPQEPAKELAEPAHVAQPLIVWPTPEDIEMRPICPVWAEPQPGAGYGETPVEVGGEAAAEGAAGAAVAGPPLQAEPSFGREPEETTPNLVAQPAAPSAQEAQGGPAVVGIGEGPTEEGRAEAAAAPEAAPVPIDQADMRRRIEETRNRLKAKAFDAMASGEAALLSRDAEGSSVPDGTDVPLDDEVARAVDRSLSQDDY